VHVVCVCEREREGERDRMSNSGSIGSLGLPSEFRLVLKQIPKFWSAWKKVSSNYHRLCSEIMSVCDSERNIYHNWPKNLTEYTRSCNACELTYIHTMTDVLH
jgi:hypothetical protein